MSARFGIAAAIAVTPRAAACARKRGAAGVCRAGEGARSRQRERVRRPVVGLDDADSARARRAGERAQVVRDDACGTSALTTSTGPSSTRSSAASTAALAAARVVSTTAAPSSAAIACAAPSSAATSSVRPATMHAASTSPSMASASVARSSSGASTRRLPVWKGTMIDSIG